MKNVAELKDVDTGMLTGLVRQLLDSPTAEVRHWEHHPVSYIKTEQSNLGLHRFSGTAQVRDQSYPWSIVLKAVHAPFNHTDPAHWNHHRREMLAYRDGLLADLPGGIRAPGCLGVIEHAEGVCWLWLEDIQDSASGSWSLAEYKIAARHLGQFNGAYAAGHPLPTQPWLSRNWLRGWLNYYEAGCQETLRLIRDEGFWVQPLLRSAFPSSIIDQILQLWSRQDELLATLHSLPQTFCHMDAYRPNLFVRHNPQGEDETVAIDWVFAGLGSLGEEIANLLAASLIWFEYDASDVNSLDEAVFTSYLTGLRDANWQGDFRLPRLGYTAACALRWGVVGLWWLRSLTDSEKQADLEKQWNRPLAALVPQWAKTTHYVLGLADEAFQLQRALY